MINFRQIFNPDYNFIGLILIVVLILLILGFNKDLKYGIKVIGKTSLIAGLITLFIAFLLNFSIQNFIPYNYQIFIQVISNNLYQNYLYASVLTILLGGICLIASKINLDKNKKLT